MGDYETHATKNPNVAISEKICEGEMTFPAINMLLVDIISMVKCSIKFYYYLN